MSRRQTLGALQALSPSQLNMRSSAAPTRVAKESQQGIKANSRKSMAPTQDRSLMASVDGRRSSAFASKPSGPKQDPRPIGDKNFMNNCIKTVIAFLSSHQFPAQVSPKTLASPTAKDFTTIVQFLFQKFDPSMRTFGKIEDDVPMFFKRLNYPFQISKSALFAVGSPHSWPHVLAAVTWLVELLNYNERCDDTPTPLFDDEARTRHDFFDYICTSYKYFLSGEDTR